MHGIGNDFVLLDAIRENLGETDFPELAVRMCERRRGIGADGILVAEKASEGRFRMRMWNPDGSESEMCGNGIRCFARYLVDLGHSPERQLQVETGAGLLRPVVLDDDRVRVDMGPPHLRRQDIPMEGPADATFIDQPITVNAMTFAATAVSMGNPHLVIFVDDVSAVPLEEWGPALENHPQFPNRTNVHFVQVRSAKHLIQRTWERGAGATLACGTGACATAVAGRLARRSGEHVLITLPGGDLEIECREDEPVFMTGPAEYVFEGTWP